MSIKSRINDNLKANVITYPCLRQSKDGDIFYFHIHSKVSPCVARANGKDPGSFHTTASAEEYEPFIGTVTLISNGD